MGPRPLAKLCRVQQTQLNRNCGSFLQPPQSASCMVHIKDIANYFILITNDIFGEEGSADLFSRSAAFDSVTDPRASDADSQGVSRVLKHFELSNVIYFI